MGGRSAVAAAVAIWIGVGGSGSLSAATAAFALVGAVLLAALALRAPDRTGTVAILLALLLGAGARGAAHLRALDARRAHRPDGAQPMWIEGRLLEPPPRESDQPVAVVGISAARPALIRGARVRVRFPAGARVEWGDRVRALVLLEIPATRRNPGGFDARAAADAAGVDLTGRAVAVERIAPSPLHGWPRATVARWRRAIEARLHSRLSPAARELVVPLVIGDRSALPTDLNARLRAAGLIHLLALSGLHVVWLASVARGACAALGGGPRSRAIAGALCAAGYAGIAGPLPSLMRAVASETLIAIARLLGRALDPVQALAVSVVVLLAGAPGWACDVGFQLSCAATLGLLALGPWLTERAGRLRAWAAPFIPTLSAQVVALPILIANFHALSWVGALANLIAVPVSGLLLGSAWLGVMLDGAWPGSGALVFAGCELLAWMLRAIAGLGAAAPAALWGAGHEAGVPIVAAAGATLLALALSPARSIRGRARSEGRSRFVAAILGVFALGLALVMAASARPLRPDRGHVWLVVLDVGQGDALALGFPEGWWLVDAGPRTPHFDAGEGVVVPFLRWAAVRRLERVVLTHDDGDHTGGFEAVRRGVPVGAVLASPPFPGTPGPGPRHRAGPVVRGDTLHRDPNVVVRWPPTPGEGVGSDWSPAASLTSPDNAAGVVIEIGSGRGRALLLADVDSLVEDRLEIASGVAVLKVGHHGSPSSSSSGFLHRLRPACAAISVGARNRFGHPSPVVLERLREVGASIDRTDLAGALWYDLGPAGARPVDWRRGDPPRSTRVEPATHGARAPARP